MHTDPHLPFDRDVAKSKVPAPSPPPVREVGLEKDDAAIRSEKKSARWKVWKANVLKSHSSATNVWIATKLNMGVAQSVSMLTSQLKKELSDRTAPEYARFYQNITE